MASLCVWTSVGSCRQVQERPFVRGQVQGKSSETPFSLLLKRTNKNSNYKELRMRPERERERGEGSGRRDERNPQNEPKKAQKSQDQTRKSWRCPGRCNFDSRVEKRPLQWVLQRTGRNHLIMPIVTHIYPVATGWHIFTVDCPTFANCFGGFSEKRFRNGDESIFRSQFFADPDIMSRSSFVSEFSGSLGLLGHKRLFRGKATRRTIS